MDFIPNYSALSEAFDSNARIPTTNSRSLPAIARALAAAAFLAALSGCVVSDSPPVTYVEPAPPQEVVYSAAPSGEVTITADADFYEPLSPYGEWVEVDGYGRCWRPRNVASDWRPYSHGRWLRTESGWYWESSDSWGWATSHYGRWNEDSRFGWYWVPDTQWAPAWVSWREGGGYAGWAPLPPRRRAGVTIDIVIAPQRFVYVEERHFSEPIRPSTVIVNNTTIVNKTVNITNTRVTNNTFINNTVNNTTVINHNNTFVAAGPRPEAIEKATGHKVNVASVREVRKQEEMKIAVKPRSAPAPRGRVPSPASRQQPKTPAAVPVAEHPATATAVHAPAETKAAPATASHGAKAKQPVEKNRKKAKQKTAPVVNDKPDDQKDQSKPQSQP
ncbi:MAG: DUF6600 domain-containing protein [Lacunisphaera sp.]